MADLPLDTLLKSYSRRLNAALWLERVLPGLTAILVAWAVCAVVVKLTTPGWFAWTPLVFAFLPVWMVVCWMRLRRADAFFGPMEAAECIDLKFRRDGTVPTYEEMREVFENPKMANQLRGAERIGLPALRGRYYIGKTLPAVLLAAAALLIPPRPEAAASPGREETLKRLADPLEQKTEKYEELIPDEQLDEFREELSDLSSTDRGLTREHWEALEELERRLNDAALQNATKNLQMAEQISEASEELAKAMEEQGTGNAGESPEGPESAGGEDEDGQEEGLSEEQMEAARKAMEELQKALAEAAKSTKLTEEQKQQAAAMQQALSQAMQQMAQSGGKSMPLDAATLKQLQSLQKSLSQSANSLSPQQMAQAMQACKGGSGKTSKTLSQVMQSMGQSMQGQQEMQMGRGQGGQGQPGNQTGMSMNGPGRGGVGRGRGDAPMVYGPESEADAEFDRKSVRNRFLDQENLLDLGIRAMPSKPDPKTFSPATRRQFEAQSGSGVSRSRISPSQREVISNYFTD